MRSLWLCVMLVVGVASGCASSSTAEKSDVEQTTTAVAPVVDEGRHMEPAGGFSWVPPVGWEMFDHQGLFKAARGSEIDGFAANINISQEMFPGPLDVYATAAKASLKQQFPTVEFMSEEKLSEGFEHFRLVTRNEYNAEMTLVQYLYFLPVPERQMVYILVCTQREGQMDLSALCETTAKSFRIEKIEEVEPQAKWFDVTVPTGWNSEKHPSLEYEMLLSPQGTVLTFAEEFYDGDLDAYIDEVLKQSGDVSVQTKDTLESSAGTLTRLLTTNHIKESGDLHQRHYYLRIPQRNSMFLAVCTEKRGATDIEECEKTVSTLTVFAE